MTLVYRSQVWTGRGSRLENLCWLCDLSLVTVNISEHSAEYLHLTAPPRGRALSKRVPHLLAVWRSFVCDLWINQKSSSRFSLGQWLNHFMWTEMASDDCRVTLFNSINLFWSRRTSVSCSSLFFFSSRAFPRCSESSAQTSECDRSAVLTLEKKKEECGSRVTLNLLHIWSRGQGDNSSVYPPH